MILNSKQLFIYCDGGSRGNPGPGACAFVVKDQNGKILHQEGKLLGVVTNNVAEYNGVLLALNYLKNNYNLKQEDAPPGASLRQVAQIKFFLDSTLVASQLSGTFKVKNSHLRELIFQIQSLISNIGYPISFSYVPREKNMDADLLVNQTLDTHHS